MLCASTGNEANENALLSGDIYSSNASSNQTVSEPIRHSGSSSSNVGKHSRRQSSRNVFMSSTIEADIASPTPSESKQYSMVREFIEGAHQRMVSDGIVTNLDRVARGITEDPNDITSVSDAFTRRYCAAKSCWFVITLLEGASVISSDISDALQEYAETVTEVIPFFTNLAVRMAAVRAVGGERVVQNIIQVGRGWEEAKIVDGSNTYIDDLSDRCARLWAKVSFLENYSLAKSAWECIVSAAFLSLLEGFSKVLVCSTEGRALMSMDLASFAAGVSPSCVMSHLNDIDGMECRFPPPSVHCERGMQYVDTVVKAFYFGERDLMKWIEGNWESYRLDHCLALIISSVGGRRSIHFIGEMVEAVKLLYKSKSVSLE